MPVILYIDGSGSSNRSVIESIAAEGYFVASVSLHQNHADVESAFNACGDLMDHLVSNADSYHIDANRIGVWGNSIGGHVASMLGTAANARSFNGNVRRSWRSSIRCVVVMGAPADLAALADSRSGSQTLRNWYGSDFGDNARDLHTWSPVNHVDRADAPFLIFHGTNDSVVPFEQAASLFEALDRKSVAVRLQPVEGAGHRLDPSEGIDAASSFFQTFLGRDRHASNDQARHRASGHSSQERGSSSRDAVIISSNDDAPSR